MTCAEAVRALLRYKRRWEVRSAGHGSKGQRWYAWAWLATASPRHHLLIRRHLKTGELAFHYCYVPEGQLLTKTRLIRAAGLRWPVEEDFEFGKDCFGLDQSQVRLYTAIARHTVLVMAALAICAVTAALLRGRTDTQAPPPIRPGQPPPQEPGMIPLTIPEIKRLLAALTAHPPLPWHVVHWDAWTRRHQARARWFHERARLARDAEIPLVLRVHSPCARGVAHREHGRDRNPVADGGNFVNAAPGSSWPRDACPAAGLQLAAPASHARRARSAPRSST
jgi:hypothetical protein